MCRKPVAEEYIWLTDIWNNTNKETIAKNNIKYLCQKFPECSTFYIRNKKLGEITDSKSDAVYAWLNLSRTNVKIPLLKLCMVAAALNVDVTGFFNPNNEE